MMHTSSGIYKKKKIEKQSQLGGEKQHTKHLSLLIIPVAPVTRGHQGIP